MFNNRCGRQNFMAMPSQNGLIDIDNNTGHIDIDFAQTQATNQNDTMTAVTSNAPIMEPMRERVVNRTIVHNVPHVCPIRTRIVNHHVYQHTYQPSYTCCEENVCEHVQCGSCCNY